MITALSSVSIYECKSDKQLLFFNILINFHLDLANII